MITQPDREETEAQDICHITRKKGVMYSESASLNPKCPQDRDPRKSCASAAMHCQNTGALHVRPSPRSLQGKSSTFAPEGTILDEYGMSGCRTCCGFLEEEIIMPAEQLDGAAALDIAPYPRELVMWERYVSGPVLRLLWTNIRVGAAP